MDRTAVRTFLYPTFLDASAVVVSRLTYVTTYQRRGADSSLRRISSESMPSSAPHSVAVSARRTYQTSASCWQSATNDFSIESATTRATSCTAFCRLLLPPPRTTTCDAAGSGREGDGGKDVPDLHPPQSSPARGLGKRCKLPTGVRGEDPATTLRFITLYRLTKPLMESSLLILNLKNLNSSKWGHGPSGPMVNTPMH